MPLTDEERRLATEIGAELTRAWQEGLDAGARDARRVVKDVVRRVRSEKRRKPRR